MCNPHIRDHARSEGYSLAIYLSGDGVDLDVYVKPDTDLDCRFRAICAETGEALRIDGWRFSVETFEHLAA